MAHGLRSTIFACAGMAMACGALAVAPGSAAALGDPGPLRPICFPVEGSVSWTDTYGEPRDGHTHQGQDLMGVKLQHLLAAHDATVSALEWDTSGNYIFLTDDEGWQYWYIHVNNDTPGTDDGANPFEWAFAPGMEVGAHVRAGQFIAFMGDSGNAESVSPHLHFELHTPDGSWGGVPVNPATSLWNAATCEAVPPETFTPWDNATDFATQQYQDFLDRAPDDDGLDYWTSNLGIGIVTPAQMVGQLMGSAEFGLTVAPVVRLYEAYFHRIPDTAGFTYWLDAYRGGMPLADISQSFTDSEEFRSDYGEAHDPGAFIDLVYQNVLGRPPDEAGRAYWLEQMHNGLRAGELMVFFSESAEYQQSTAGSVYVTMAYFGMLRRTPEQSGYDYWISQPLDLLVDGIRYSEEYAARFA